MWVIFHEKKFMTLQIQLTFIIRTSCLLEHFFFPSVVPSTSRHNSVLCKVVHVAYACFKIKILQSLSIFFIKNCQITQKCNCSGEKKIGFALLIFHKKNVWFTQLIFKLYKLDSLLRKTNCLILVCCPAVETPFLLSLMYYSYGCMCKKSTKSS